MGKNNAKKKVKTEFQKRISRMKKLDNYLLANKLKAKMKKITE